MRRLRALAAATGCLLLSACLHAGRVQVMPEPAAAKAQADSLAECVGMPPFLPLKSLRWQVSYSDVITVAGVPGLFAGWSDFLTHTITLVEPHRNNPVLIRHELAHSLYMIVGHPDFPFQACNLMGEVPFVPYVKP